MAAENVSVELDCARNVGDLAHHCIELNDVRHATNRTNNRATGYNHRVGKRGFDELQSQSGLNLIMLALTITFVVVVVGSIVFKVLQDKDRERRLRMQEKDDTQG